MQRGTSKLNVDICTFKTERKALQMITDLTNWLLEELTQTGKDDQNISDLLFESYQKNIWHE